MRSSVRIWTLRGTRMALSSNNEYARKRRCRLGQNTFLSPPEYESECVAVMYLTDSYGTAGRIRHHEEEEEEEINRYGVKLALSNCWLYISYVSHHRRGI